MLMEVKNNLKIMFLSFKYNLMRCMENNVAFITSVISMILNNASFIIQWLTIFGICSNLGGYSLNDVMLFWALSSGAYGIGHLFFNGIMRMPEYIEEGKLDAYLVMPKNTLCYLSTSSLEPSAFGDLLYGYIALLVFNFSIRNIFLYTILVIFGGLIYTSFVCILNTLTFYFYRSSIIADAFRDAMLSSSLYPDIIFNRFVKIIFFILIPSAFAVWIPVHIIMDFNIISLLVVIGFTIFIVLLAFYAFNRGLKSYSSSNLMGGRS